MGTRHLQTVIDKSGRVRIRQYGQWDGYPEGQGVEILQYLRSGDLQKYQSELLKIEQINKKQISEVEMDTNWRQNYPYLDRDCGSNIHQMIEDGKVKFVFFLQVGEEDWCEGFYTINFKDRTFTSKYHEVETIFSLDNLPTDAEYLEKMGVEGNQTI